MPIQFLFNKGRMGTAGIKTIFFLGLAVLFSGFLILNAQEGEQAEGDNQQAPVA